MGNLALNSAEEPDNQRAITGTAEVPTKRDNDAALALGARPIEEHELAVRHRPSRCVHDAHQTRCLRTDTDNYTPLLLT